MHVSIGFTTWRSEGVVLSSHLEIHVYCLLIFSQSHINLVLHVSSGWKFRKMILRLLWHPAFVLIIIFSNDWSPSWTATLWIWPLCRRLFQRKSLLMTLSFRTKSFIFDFYSSHQSRIPSFTKRCVTLELIIGMKSRVRSLLVYTLNMLLSSISFIFSRSSIDLLDLSLLIVLISPRYTLPSQNECIGTHIDLICLVIWNVIGLRI